MQIAYSTIDEDGVQTGMECHLINAPPRPMRQSCFLGCRIPLNALGSLVATVHGGEFNEGSICFLRGFFFFADAVDGDDDRLRTIEELVRLTGNAVLFETPPLFLLLDSSAPIAT